MQDTTMDTPRSDMASDAYLRQLQATFAQLPNEIDLYLFTPKGMKMPSPRRIARLFELFAS